MNINKQKEVFFISDTHFGHKNILEYSKRPFNSPEEMNDALITNWNSVVKSNDRVYLLGDVAMAKSQIQNLKYLNGKIILVMGNHDIYPTKEYLPYVEDIRGYVYKDGFIGSHIPIYRGSDYGIIERYKMNICGHIHEKVINDPFYFNVSVEQINYTPINFEVIEDIYLKRQL